MEQFKIPVDVQIEDKIVGPLTLKQLIICGIGFGLAYTIYVTLSETFFIEIWLPPVVIISVITLAFAFVKPRGIPLWKYIFLALEFFMRPKKREWNGKDGRIFMSYSSFKASEEKNKMEKKSKSNSRKFKKIGDVTEVLDKPRIPIDVLKGK